MLIYQEQSVSGVQAKNSNTKQNDENYEIQKPQVKNVAYEEQIKDLVVNTILIFNLQMNNKSMNDNYKSEGFGIQDFEDDLSWVSIESTIIFAKSLNIFTQSSYLFAQST